MFCEIQGQFGFCVKKIKTLKTHFFGIFRLNQNKNMPKMGFGFINKIIYLDDPTQTQTNLTRLTFYNKFML